MRTVRLAMLAVVIPVVLGTTVPAFAKDKLFANATVKTVSATSVTATADGKDMTFAVNAKTTVVGKGMGTKGDAKKGKPTITDLVAVGDRVSVTYGDAPGMLAKRIDLVAKK